MEKLSREFYVRSTVDVARELLGTLLVHRSEGVERIGRIVEVEAYLGAHDLAAHSSKGRTKRTEIMFGPAGHAYVYLIYGMHHCMNVVTEPEGNAAAVLLRALEPVSNLDSRTQGPGLLCKSMRINRSRDGHDLLSDELFIAKAAPADEIAIIERPRIGIDYAGEWVDKPLRFYIAGNAWISRK